MVLLDSLKALACQLMGLSRKALQGQVTALHVVSCTLLQDLSGDSSRKRICKEHGRYGARARQAMQT